MSGPPPVPPLKTPEVGGRKLRFDSKAIALTVVFSASYAILVLTLAGLSFQLVQVRIAEREESER